MMLFLLNLHEVKIFEPADMENKMHEIFFSILDLNIPRSIDTAIRIFTVYGRIRAVISL